MQKSVKNYDANEAKKHSKSKSVIFLDVRTARERAAYQISGSIHIPLHELKEKLNDLEKFKGKEIICYCHSGSRSLTAAAILNKNGFLSANLKGGIIEWNN